MISKPVFSTNKIKMSWREYIFTHLIPTWFKSFNDNFVMWRDLVTGDYEKYTLLRDDEPFQECYDWFWGSINLDETYPKEFLEYLMQMADDVMTGKVKTYPMDEVMEDLKRDTIDPSVLEDWMGEPLTEEKKRELQEGGYVVAEED